MKHIIEAIQKCLNDNNYTAALMICLTIPDICGKLEEKTISSERYISWFDKYINPNYSDFLSGNDCYALRCAILHEGSNDISTQKKRDILDKFYFTTKGGGHLTKFSNCIIGDVNYNNKEFVQLSVDAFCKDIIESVKKWENDISGNIFVEENIKLMFEIHDPSKNLGGIQFGN